MCVAVPGRVESVEGQTAVVDVGGATVRTRIDLVPEVAVGEYVLVHAGFAIETVDETSALEIRALLEEADRLCQVESEADG
jgi:hydrogenase expression/formation protein HypC